MLHGLFTEQNTEKYMLTATLKNKENWTLVYALIPNDFPIFKGGYSEMLKIKDSDGRTIIRSRERLKIIQLDNNENGEGKVLFVTEEIPYLLAVCSVLNLFRITYELDSSIAYLTDYCLTINEDNLNDRIEENS